MHLMYFKSVTWSVLPDGVKQTQLSTPCRYHASHWMTILAIPISSGRILRPDDF